MWGFLPITSGACTSPLATLLTKPEKRRCPRCGGFNSTPVNDKLECLGKSDPHDPHSAPCKAIFRKKIGYVFQSDAWKKANLQIIELTKVFLTRNILIKVFRQSDDTFIAALNKTRIGKPDRETLRLFEECRRPLVHDINIKPTKMYPIRALVQMENTKEFEALKTPIHIYTAVDEQSSPDGFGQNLLHVLNDLQASSGLRLRVGTQVMLLANLDVKEGLVNGSRGAIVDFVTFQEALQYLVSQDRLLGTTSNVESKAVTELRLFTRGNQQMQFPKVLFETKNRTKEVRFHGEMK